MALLALDPHLTGLRWLPEEQLHLTLSFLGNVEPSTEDRLRQALQEVRVPPFFLPLCGIGVFDSHGSPSVVWTGVGQGILTFLRYIGTFNMQCFMQASNLTSNLFVRT